jgi:hypothetical protein
MSSNALGLTELELVCGLELHVYEALRYQCKRAEVASQATACALVAERRH